MPSRTPRRLLALAAGLAAAAAMEIVQRKDSFVVEETVCAIDRNQDLYCWGGNTDMIMNDSYDKPSGEPKKIPGLPAIQRVQIYTNTACALAVDGRVFCWSGTTPEHRFTAHTASHVEMTTGLVCIVSLTDDNVWCEGSNWRNRITPDEAESWTTDGPLRITSSGVARRDLLLTSENICVLNDGSRTIWCNRDTDAMGIADALHLTTVEAAACHHNICAFVPGGGDGTGLTLVGKNSARRMGNALELNAVGTVDLTFPDTVRDVSFAGSAVSVLLHDGSLYTSGSNYGFSEKFPGSYSSMTLVETDTQATSYKQQNAVLCRSIESNHVECRGDNSIGQLGRGDTGEAQADYAVIQGFDIITARPTTTPTTTPTAGPTTTPTARPTANPTVSPTAGPTGLGPTFLSTERPSGEATPAPVRATAPPVASAAGDSFALPIALGVVALLLLGAAAAARARARRAGSAMSAKNPLHT